MRKSRVAFPGHLSEKDENERLDALHRYGILDTLPEQGYDDVTELAAFICETPISLVSLVDKERQWFKSEHGLGARQTPRAQSFCANTLADAHTLVVEDARTDARFKDNPLVLGDPNIVFYAGAPIVEKNGHVLGTVCVIDTHPRGLSEKQIAALEALARQVLSLLEQRTTIAQLGKAVVAFEAADRLAQENELRFQAYINASPSLAWMANADGWIFWYNRRWYEYTGTTEADMEGWGWQSVHDPATLPRVMERWSASIQSGEPVEMVFPLRGGDGVYRPFLTRVIPIRNESGEIVQWLGSNVEIGELERSRLSLEASEAALNQVLNATSDAVLSVNRDWAVLYMNPVAEHLYGPAKSIIGRNLWEVFPETQYPGSLFVEHYTRAMNEGVAGKFEAEYGSPLNATLGLEVYPSPDGIVVFSRDITKLKLAAAAALQSEKLAAVGRLASSIAHEINNPLESVTNLVYLARRSSDQTAAHEYLDVAERELRRASAITSQTLRFHRQSTRPNPINGAELFHETLQLYQGRLINSHIHVEKRERALQPVTCFEGEIRQVLNTIVGNSIDAMHPCGGRLLLRTRQVTHPRTGQKGIALTVADTGSGMSPQVQMNVFDAFFTTKGIGGTGLGLWVSKEITERHQGSLRFRSSNQPHRHGTVFVLFLPFGIGPVEAVAEKPHRSLAVYRSGAV